MRKARPGTSEEWAKVLDHEGLACKAVGSFCHNDPTKFDDYMSIAHEAMLVAVQSYDPSRGSFSHFAWNLITNALRDEIKNSDEAISSDPLGPLEEVNTYNTENLEETSSSASKDYKDPRLRAALLTLTDVEARVVFEHYFLDWSIRDIAADLRWSKSKTQRILAEAMVKLRAFFPGEGGGLAA